MNSINVICNRCNTKLTVINFYGGWDLLVRVQEHNCKKENMKVLKEHNYDKWKSIMMSTIEDMEKEVWREDIKRKGVLDE